MDIQVRFDDGTTRLFDGCTVCWVGLVLTRAREEPIRQHRGATVWIPSAGRNGRAETADEQIERLDTDVASLRRQLADETTRANLAERNAMAWEGRAKAAERALTTTDADRVVAMAAAKVRADAAERRAKAWKGSAREFWREAREAWRVFRWLRDAARDACDREMGEGHQYPEGVKVSTLVAHLNTMFEPTSGDLINARARAGAEVADARDALARIPKAASLIREMAQARFDAAKEAYQRAQDAELAHGS